MSELSASGSPLVAPSSAAAAQRFNWQYAPLLLLCHLVGLLALVPWFFSWTAVVLGVLGCYLFGWHTAWAVNSVCHRWGYRGYATGDLSRNNVLIGFLASGEGWHNNHHADPNSARHGRRWWEFDLAWLTIRLLEAVGLAWDVKRPSPQSARSAPIAEPEERNGAVR